MNATFSHPAAAAFVLVSTLMSFNAAGAQMPLSCTAATLGATACLAGKLCACTYDRGAIATGIPAGYRWDCGILRPGCGSALEFPATLNPYSGPYPTTVGIDRSRNTLTIEQTNSNTNSNLNTNSSLPPGRPVRPPVIGDPLPLLPRE